MSVHSISTHSLSGSPGVTWGITCELGPCRVVKDENLKKFTTFTFRFRIAQTVHEFTSRYSKLYKFHESLIKSEKFQKAFSYDPPKFPPKSYWTDFTKPKNYKKRAHKLLKWFNFLLSKPAIIRDPIFQKGIHLQKELQLKMNNIAIDLQSRKRVIDIYDKNKIRKTKQIINNSNNNELNEKKIIIQPQPRTQNMDYIENNIKNNINNNIKNNKNNIVILNDKDFLLSLLQETETKMIFCDDIFEEQHIGINESNYDLEKLNKMYIFDICDILPVESYGKYPKNESISNISNISNIRIPISYLNHIDNVAFEIRDCLLNSCDLNFKELN